MNYSRYTVALVRVRQQLARSSSLPAHLMKRKLRKSSPPPRLVCDVGSDSDEAAGDGSDEAVLVEQLAGVASASSSSTCAEHAGSPSVADAADGGDHNDDLPPGPRTLEETMLWCDYAFEKLEPILGEAGRSWSEVASSFSDGCVLALTSHFSGVGTAEMAMSFIIDKFKSLGAGDMDVVCWSATDIDKTCIEILSNHTGTHSPKHVFGDILDRVSPVHFRRIQMAQGRCCDAYRREAEQGSAKSRKNLMNKWSKEFLKEANSTPKDVIMDHNSTMGIATSASALALCFRRR